MGFIGKLFVGFLAAVAALGIVGFVMQKRAARREGDGSRQEELLSEKVVENVFDLKDRFNRARQMDRDGQ